MIDGTKKVGSLRSMVRVHLAIPTPRRQDHPANNHPTGPAPVARWPSHYQNALAIARPECVGHHTPPNPSAFPRPETAGCSVVRKPINHRGRPGGVIVSGVVLAAESRNRAAGANRRTVGADPFYLVDRPLPEDQLRGENDCSCLEGNGPSLKCRGSAATRRSRGRGL